MDLIDKENWSSLSADVKGDAYEGLLEKNAQDTKSGAGQYFTPRPLIQGIVDVMIPQPGETVCDPACGTGGFLLAAHDYVVRNHPHMTKAERQFLKEKSFKGWELVQATARLCAMNLLLHGIGSQEYEPIEVGDSLASDPGERFDLVLTNPPFSKKSSSTTIVGEGGKVAREKDTIERDDFWTTTSNKQLNFVAARQDPAQLASPHFFISLPPASRAHQRTGRVVVARWLPNVACGATRGGR